MTQSIQVYFLKAVFHKIYLVHSWILCPKYNMDIKTRLDVWCEPRLGCLFAEIWYQSNLVLSMVYLQIRSKSETLKANMIRAGSKLNTVASSVKKDTLA